MSRSCEGMYPCAPPSAPAPPAPLSQVIAASTDPAASTVTWELFIRVSLLRHVICAPAPPPLTGHRCFHSSCCRRRGLGAAAPPADSGLWFHCEECRRVHQVLSGCGFGACIHSAMLCASRVLAFRRCYLGTVSENACIHSVMLCSSCVLAIHGSIAVLGAASYIASGVISCQEWGCNL